MSHPDTSSLDQFKLTDQTAVVTGASRGIGKGIAIALAQAGADVVCASRNQDDIQQTASVISKLCHSRVLGVRCDVSRDVDRQNLIETTVKEFGSINILVNNAGGSRPNDPLKTSAEQFGHALNWNVVPAFDLTRLVAPIMKNTPPACVINISSAAARYRQKNFSAYGSAKAALSHLTRLLAQDFAPDISVNGIEPGAIKTEALKKYLSAEKEIALIASTPLKRLGTVEDVGSVAVFLASPAAQWITGKIIELDGGVETPAW